VNFTRPFRKLLIAALVVLSSTASRCVQDTPSTTATGDKALSLTSEMVAFGPRPPGSATLEAVRGWIRGKVSAEGLTMTRDEFTADTPLGAIEMVNLSYVIPGRSGADRILLVAHYDSKRFVGFDFVGANDSASAVALLLALIPDFKARSFPFDVQTVFVDGEEALVQWSPIDSLYGSRRLAATLTGGKAVRGAIVLDMIGDRDLRLIRESRTDSALQSYLQEAAAELGLERLLDSRPQAVDDDHMPLIEAGVPTLHLMDFTFGGNGSPGTFWHTERDTVDKVSAESLSAVGELVLGVLDRLAN